MLAQAPMSPGIERSLPSAITVPITLQQSTLREDEVAVSCMQATLREDEVASSHVRTESLL